MQHEIRDTRGRQFDTAWKLTSYHLDGLSTEECLLRPASAELHVVQVTDGTWHADCHEHEGYDLGPSSIAWLTWHIVSGSRWCLIIQLRMARYHAKASGGQAAPMLRAH